MTEQVTPEELADWKKRTMLVIPIGVDNTLRLIAEVERLTLIVENYL